MKKLATLLIVVLAVVVTIAVCTTNGGSSPSDSGNSTTENNVSAIVGTYIPQQVYWVEDGVRELEMDGSKAVIQSGGASKFVFYDDGTGYMEAADGTNVGFTWEDGSLFIPEEGVTLYYKLNGDQLVLFPDSSQFTEGYREIVAYRLTQ